MKITVGDDGADADFLICIKATDPTPFTDNVRGVCSRCGVAIQWRPHAPRQAKKLCFQCGDTTIKEDTDVKLMVTKTSAAEANQYFKKQRH